MPRAVSLRVIPDFRKPSARYSKLTSRLFLGTVVNGSLPQFYLVEIRTKLSPVSLKPFGKAESAKALKMLTAHCESSGRVAEPTKRLIVIILAMICLHSGGLTEEAKAFAKGLLLDIQPKRIILGAYTTDDLLAKGDESAEQRDAEDKDYAEDWEVFKQGYRQSTSGPSRGKFSGIVRRFAGSH
jgi:hypothetical protein